jgi:hypothetical protein
MNIDDVFKCDGDSDTSEDGNWVMLQEVTLLKQVGPYPAGTEFLGARVRVAQPSHVELWDDFEGPPCYTGPL